MYPEHTGSRIVKKLQTLKGISLMKTGNSMGDLHFVRRIIIDNIKFSCIDVSPIHGFGLFAEADITRGTVLGFLDGQVMAWDAYDALAAELKESMGNYKDYVFMEWNALDTRTLLVRPFRTKYSYINHSPEPNLELIYDPIRVAAKSDIKKGEELLLDYSKEPLKEEYLEGHGKTYL